MQPSLLLAHDLLEEVNGKHNTKLHFTSIAADNIEGYKSHSFKGAIHLKAQGALSAAYAASQLKVALKSGYVGPWLGEISPTFPQRWLWLIGSEPFSLLASTSVDLPADLNPKNLSAQLNIIAKRLISLGYNGIIFGGYGSSCETSLNSEKIFEEIIKTFHSFNLKIAIKPSESLSLEALKNILKKFPIDALFWQSSVETKKKCCEKTLSDLACHELRELEKIFSSYSCCSLIYFLPCRAPFQAKLQASLLCKLCDEASSKTTLAFSSVAGEAFNDYLPPHPFWEKLYQREQPCVTPLLPIIDMGSIESGSGLWPAPPFELINRFMPQKSFHSFDGAIILTKFLPHSGTYLDASLWMAGHALFCGHLPIEMLLSIWLKAFHPTLDKEFFLQKCGYLRQTVKELSYLLSSFKNGFTQSAHVISEVLNCSMENAYCSLQSAKQLITKNSKNKFTNSQLDIEGYFRYFSHDFHRLFFRMQGKNFSLSKRAIVDDKKFGFWISEEWEKSGHFTFPTKPNGINAPPDLEKIFLENNCLIM